MRIATFLPFLATFTFLASREVHATPIPGDFLIAQNISIVGDIYLETGTSGTTAVKPITIPTILSTLGITGTNVTKVRYYFDQTTNSYVIAPKSVGVSGIGTPIATIFTIGDVGDVQWNPNVSSTLEAGTDSGLNGDLSGTGMEHIVLIRGVETTSTSFYLYGMISTEPAIMKGTIVGVFRP